MPKRLQNDIILNQLVVDFEFNTDNGLPKFFEDKDLIQLIQFYENEMDFEKAIEVADIGIEQFKFQSDFYAIKTRLHINMGDFSNAISVLETGKSISPEDLEFKLLELELLFRKGSEYEALQNLSKLLTDAQGEDKIDLLLCKATLTEMSKDYDSMFSALKRVLQIDHDNIYALEKIWICVELCRNYKESIQLHHQVINKNPYSFHAWYNLGHAYACIGEYENSIMALEYSFLTNDSFEAGYKDCAEMCFQVKKYSQALSIYLDALKQFGPDHELFMSIGQCYLELEKPKKAYEFLSKAVSVDPYDDEAQYYLGKCFLAKGHWVKAIDCFNQAIQIDDRREEYYSDIAQAYEQIENYSFTNYYHKKATETGPEQVIYWQRHLEFLIRIKAFDTAVEVLEEANQNTYGVEFEYINAALFFYTNFRADGLEILKNAISEDKTAVTSFFKVYPQYKEEADLYSFLTYHLQDKA